MEEWKATADDPMGYGPALHAPLSLLCAACDSLLAGRCSSTAVSYECGAVLNACRPRAVVTNPKPDLQLRETDAVFVLARKVGSDSLTTRTSCSALLREGGLQSYAVCTNIRARGRRSASSWAKPSHFCVACR